MKESIIKSYNELPLFMNATQVGSLLGLSPSTCYDLMKSEGFPTLKIGTRMIVPKEKFIKWVDKNVGDEE